MLNLSCLEIPNDDISWEAGEGILGAGQVFSVGRDFDSWDRIKNVHEILLSWPLKKVCSRERICRTTTVEPSG